MLGEMIEEILKEKRGVLIFRLEDDGSYSVETREEPIETEDNAISYNAENVHLAVYGLSFSVGILG